MTDADFVSIDAGAVRSHFPALSHGGAWFDGPGGTQTPDVVAAAIAATMLAPLSNRGRHSPGERNAEAAVAGARQAIADLLGADPGGVVFGRSMTALTFEFSRTLAKDWHPGDEVVVSRLDHDANVRPWVLAAQARGVAVRWIDFDPATGELTADDVTAALSDRTRLVALTGASNLIGTTPDLAAIAARVHEAGALFYVDGVHLTAHAFIDAAALGADFYACSPYKFFGPHCGVVAARPQVLETLRPDKLLPSADTVPERFELGTLPYELMAGTTAAVDFIAGLTGPADLGGSAAGRREALRTSWTALAAHERVLLDRLEEGLAELPGVRLWSRAAHRTPTLLLTFEGRDPGEATAFLAQRAVYAPSGSFYAYEVARHLGLDPRIGGLRIGLAAYHDEDDVDRLLAGLRAFQRSG